MEINGTIFNCELEDILIELNRQLGIFDKRRESGNNIQVCCPYHNDRKPSAGIRKTDGMFHCFSCGEAHSLPELISFCFGKENDIIGAYGWQWLNRYFLSVAVEERKDVILDFSRNTNLHNSDRGNSSSSHDDRYVDEEELDSYRYTHPYMYQRGLTDDVIERFDIGYDKNTRCITFPIRNINGKTLFIARRSVDTKYFNYPEGVEKPLYGLYELYQLQTFPTEIYVCESMIDALTIWCYNKYAVALNGLGNELSIAQIRKLPCRKIILATDKDKAGKEARLKLKDKLNNKIVTELDYKTYPDYAKDINDMTKEEFYNLGEIF